MEAEAVAVDAVAEVDVVKTDPPRVPELEPTEEVNLPLSKTISLPYDRPNEKLKASLRRSKQLGLGSTLSTLMRQ